MNSSGCVVYVAVFLYHICRKTDEAVPGAAKATASGSTPHGTAATSATTENELCPSSHATAEGESLPYYCNSVSPTEVHTSAAAAAAATEDSLLESSRDPATDTAELKLSSTYCSSASKGESLPASSGSVPEGAAANVKLLSASAAHHYLLPHCHSSPGTITSSQQSPPPPATSSPKSPQLPQPRP